MAAIYHHDYEAFGRNVLNAPWMEALMLERAERGKAVAEAIAPFDAMDKDGRHYRDDFAVSSGTHGGIHHDRAYGELSNSNSAALFVEFGTKNNDAHATLRVAMEAMR